ncbi:MAG: phosphotriesterase [Terriglobia bacterium]
MNRREFLLALPRLGTAGGLAVCGRSLADSSPGGRINTVLGPVRPEALGMTLMHEHIMVDFIGADKIDPSRYDTTEVQKIVLPHLQRLYQTGCRTLVECTPAFLGRDPELLKRLSQVSGLHLITNTGIYGAANDKFVPPVAFKKTAEQLAEDWQSEIKKGIGQTGVKAGIIKIGVDPGPLSQIDTKLVKAAALTHRETGLSIATHCVDGRAAMESIEILKQTGVAPDAFVWVHAQREKNKDFQLTAARKGAWIEFDGVGGDTMNEHRDLLANMKSHNLLGQVLISQDAGWYHVGEAGGGEFRSYAFLLDQFVPMLRREAFSPSELRQLLIENPQRVLTSRVRKNNS